MKKLKLWFIGLSFCLILTFSQSLCAQVKVQFDDNDNLIRIWNLLSDPIMKDFPKCGISRTFKGEIIEVINVDSDIASSFEFKLKLAKDKNQQKIIARFTWRRNIKFRDVNNLLQKNNQITVKASRCGDNDYNADEVRLTPLILPRGSEQIEAKSLTKSQNAKFRAALDEFAAGKQEFKVLSIGVINAAAVSLPLPNLTTAARDAGAGGKIVVRVLKDKEGNIAVAVAVEGHPALYDVSERAAKRARFRPTLLNGNPVYGNGMIVYDFDRNK